MRVIADNCLGTSYFHRLRPGIKLTIFFVFSLVLFFIKRLDITMISLAVVLLLYRTAGFSLAQPWRQIRPVWWLFVVLFIFQFFANSWQNGLIVVLRFACLLLFAGLITLTTLVSHMMETFEYAFQFLKPFGVNPAKISLALSLTLRFIPVLGQIRYEVYEAQKARGLESSIIATLMPITIRILKMSKDITAAIEARCYDSAAKNMTVRDIVPTALFATLIATLGFLPPIPLPGFPVPITAQTLGVMLAGPMLGTKKGFYAIIIFFFLVATGLPLLSGGHGGLGVFFGPSAGYCMGWALAAWLGGFLYHTFRNSLTPVKEISFLLLSGIIAIHCPGIFWLAYSTGISVKQAFFVNLLFVPGDVIKIAIAYFIIRNIRKAFPNALH
ncbi:MAG: biotin transport system substrate-specific component [Candidatus Tokpelaia sp. JSC189]|nr:MAG: biotin transport system substrate-specific component [Candidatus Tokpelaia sp. JSC189]